MIDFFVPGIPVPGGSKRAFPIRGKDGRTHVAVTDASGVRGKNWRAVVALAAKDAMADPPLEDALELAVTFTLPRPAGHFGKRGLKPSARPFPTTKPDATKLLRLLEDACTGILWRDDAQIVRQTVTKIYGETPGARVRVAVLSDAADAARETA